MSVTLHSKSQDIEFKSWKFPVGEIGVQITGDIDPTELHFVKIKFQSNDDIFVALNLVDALSRLGVAKRNIKLDIPYFPYSRQDRVCHAGESFALKVAFDMLATAGVQIYTRDMHSNVFLDFAPIITNKPQHYLCMGLPEYDLLVGPDAGSTKKVSSVAHNHNTPYITLYKRRVGRSIEIDVPATDSIKGRVCIVDDLCDGGGTFIAAANALTSNPSDGVITGLDLYVTHGFFTAGIDKLKDVFDNIYCSVLYSEDQETINFVKVI